VTEQLVRLECGAWLRKEPKTASSVRSITLSPFVAEQLGGHSRATPQSGSTGWCSRTPRANPLISSNFWNNHFAKAQQHVGVTCRFHDLRHTSVALAFASGVNPKAIQTRMGHSSITVTLTGMATSSL
jgi:integrase